MHRTGRILVLPFVGLLLVLSACSGDAQDASEACGHTEADPEASLASLQQRIEELGGDEAYPVVPLELFFEGNHDEASVAPNLVPHPGMDTFRCVLREIAARPDVAHVVAQISEVAFEDEYVVREDALPRIPPARAPWVRWLRARARPLRRLVGRLT